MKFEQLIDAISYTHSTLQQSAAKAVNRHITFRNWLIGYYLVEFEQKGEDRAVYGSELLKQLAEKIKIKGLTAPELSRCRQFYHSYPEMFGLITQEMKHILPQNIFGSSTQKTQSDLTDDEQQHFFRVLSNISYTHLTELIKIDDKLKRRYYELLILSTQLSVKELKRQINSLTFERLGISSNKEMAFEELKKKLDPASASDLVKSHYFFDFLNLPLPALVSEQQLETALLDHLQEFIIELGRGFCFEARQQRILIGDEYFFIDLVFYHRLLKCHVLIDLKVEEFSHANAGQFHPVRYFLYSTNFAA